MKILILLAFVFATGPVRADVVIVPDSLIPAMGGADVVVLGEVHDNPRHHQLQKAVVDRLQPAALVFEMLTSDQAALITDENRDNPVALQSVMDWEKTGWPDFMYYYQIIDAAPDAHIYGAGLTRVAARAAFEAGIVGYFGPDATLYGLDQPLDPTEQSERAAFQRAAHCDALPEDLLPKMVGLQRLRDAYLARTVVAALSDTGGPVVVITGNGHARKDRGLAVYLLQARPDLKLYVVGLSEDGHIDGVFDQVLDFPAVERPDPCLAFQ